MELHAPAARRRTVEPPGPRGTGRGAAATPGRARYPLRPPVPSPGGPPMTPIPQVLFVCVHNAGRSQMAAAFLAHHAQGAVEVRSAGSAPADAVDPAVREAMAEVGIDLSGRQPKRLT